MSKFGYLVILLFAACLVAGASAATDAITYTDSAGNTIGFAYAVTADGELAVGVAAVSDGTISQTTDDVGEAEVNTDVTVDDGSAVAVSAAGDAAGDSAATVTVVADAEDATIEQTAEADNNVEGAVADQETVAVDADLVVAASTATAADGTTASSSLVAEESDFVAVEQGAGADNLAADAGQTFVAADAEELEATTSATQPDGTTASTSLEAEDVTAVIPVEQDASASGNAFAASAGQTIAGLVGEDVVAETSAEDANGNSVEVTAVAEDSWNFNADQGAAAMTGVGATGGQTATITGTGFIGAFADADSADGTWAEANVMADSDTGSAFTVDQTVGATGASVATQEGAVVTNDGFAYAGTSAGNPLEITAAGAYVEGTGVIEFDQTSGALPVGFPNVGGVLSMQDTEVNVPVGEGGIYTYAENGFGTSGLTSVEVEDGTAAAMQIAGANMFGAGAGQLADVNGVGEAETEVDAADGCSIDITATSNDANGEILAAQGAIGSNTDVIGGQIAYVDTPTGSGSIETDVENGDFPGHYVDVVAGETGGDLFGIQAGATGVFDNNDAIAGQAVIVGVPIIFGGEGGVTTGYTETEAGNSLGPLLGSYAEVGTVASAGTASDLKFGAVSVGYAGAFEGAAEFEINNQVSQAHGSNVYQYANSYSFIGGNQHDDNNGDHDTWSIGGAVAVPFFGSGVLVFGL